jgi:hypothetical protein
VLNLYLIRVSDLDLMELSISWSINTATTVAGLLAGLPLLLRCLSAKGVITFSFIDQAVQQLLFALLAMSAWQRFTHAGDGGSGSGGSTASGSLGDDAAGRDNHWRYLGPYIVQATSFAQVRRTPRWPGSWADCTPLLLHSHKNAWANLYLLGQPNTFLTAVHVHALHPVSLVPWAVLSFRRRSSCFIRISPYKINMTARNDSAHR